MKNSIFRLLIPLLVLLFFNNSKLFAADTIHTDGTLTFIYDLNEGQCTIPVSDGRVHEIHHGDKPTPAQPCKGHSIRAIKFNEVRSAVTVELSSELDKWGHGIGCEDNPDNFKFEMRTIKNNPSSQPIALDDLKADQVGLPIIPGIVLKSRWVTDPNNVNRELTCIKINYD